MTMLGGPRTDWREAGEPGGGDRRGSDHTLEPGRQGPRCGRREGARHGLMT